MRPASSAHAWYRPDSLVRDGTHIFGRPFAAVSGLGVYVWTVRGETMIGQTGQIPGFATMVGSLPAHDATIVTLGNDDTIDARVVGRRLAAIAIRTPYPDVAPVAMRAEELQADGHLHFDPDEPSYFVPF